jgi:hypothetical protein
MVFLLFAPAYAGHSTSGGFGWCECTPVQGVCPCCGGINRAAANDQVSDSESITQNASDTSDGALELDLLWFLMWLNIRA